MKYVALLSGGKDSCFNLLHCEKNHHQLVAAATLSPGSGKEEIDSYLYQTVGQDGVALIATAIDVPLYRRVIHGHPIEQGMEYGARSPRSGGIVGDETEDLYALLKTVLDHHPDIQAVAVGAILSNYQRLRVEHVSRRLSLTPLAYLWQRNQTALLFEMLHVGLNAVLIKVAGAGLTPSHLGLDLSTMSPTLARLHALYGTHPCGEGGEYESFTLDCPGIFKHRVVLRETESVGITQGDTAPVAYLRIKSAHVVQKCAEELSADAKHPDVTVPPLLEPCFHQAYLQVARSLLDCKDPSLTASVPVTRALLSSTPSVRVLDSWIAIGNVQVPSGVDVGSIGEEVTRCFNTLQDLLGEHTPSGSPDVLARSAMITLLLPTLDASTFNIANTAYSAFFGASPPARACIGIGGERVTLDCIAWIPEGTHGESGTRRSLHVQSLSYWAPANIGPYSQAITISPWTFVSGQIGLLPASLTLPVSSSIPAPYPYPPDIDTDTDAGRNVMSTCIDASSLPLETALVLQHTARVICASPDVRRASVDDGGFGCSDVVQQPATDVDEDMDTRAQGGHVQLVFYYLTRMQDVPHVQRGVELVNEGLIPKLYAVVDALPRGARLEKVIVTHSGRQHVPHLDNDSDDDDEPRHGHPTFVFDLGDIGTNEISRPDSDCDDGMAASSPPSGELKFLLHWETSRFASSNEACTVIFVRGRRPILSEDDVRAIPMLKPFLTRSLSAKVFVTPRFECLSELLPFVETWFDTEMPALTIIPARHVISSDGREWDFALASMAV